MKNLRKVDLADIMASPWKISTVSLYAERYGWYFNQIGVFTSPHWVSTWRREWREP
ncbi:MAG: hypothetical protein AB4426_20740 [Xenococcaceae cyanobacterium]